MEFSDKRDLFRNLRAGMAGEVARCGKIVGSKRAKTGPVNTKLWRDLYPALLAELAETAAAQQWPAGRLLDSRLRLYYSALVVNLESRNKVVPYDYMDFARRIGEVWEVFCKLCWDAPVNTALKRLKSPTFATVRSELLSRFSGLVNASGSKNGEAILAEYRRVVELLGNINLKEDEYCAVEDRRLVIDFKSGFGSNEKGNTERLLTVAKIYHTLPEAHECVLVVRAAEGEGNNYLQVLKSSGLWRVCCGPEAYEFIRAVTGFDLAAWIHTNVAFHEDMEREAYHHLTEQNLTKYLGW